MSNTKGISKQPRKRMNVLAPAVGIKRVPIQVMVPEEVRRQVAMMGAETGENIRTIVLRGLKKLGIQVPDSELVDRRGRKRSKSQEG